MLLKWDESYGSSWLLRFWVYENSVGQRALYMLSGVLSACLTMAWDWGLLLLYHRFFYCGFWFFLIWLFHITTWPLVLVGDEFYWQARARKKGSFLARNLWWPRTERESWRNWVGKEAEAKGHVPMDLFDLHTWKINMTCLLRWDLYCLLTVLVCVYVHEWKPAAFV